MTNWIEKAKAQLDAHATTLHAIEAIAKIAKAALVDPGTDTYKVIQIVEKIADALIAGFTGAHSPEEVAKQIKAQLDSVDTREESINEAADRALADKFRSDS